MTSWSFFNSHTVWTVNNLPYKMSLCQNSPPPFLKQPLCKFCEIQNNPSIFGCEGLLLNEFGAILKVTLWIIPKQPLNSFQNSLLNMFLKQRLSLTLGCMYFGGMAKIFNIVLLVQQNVFQLSLLLYRLSGYFFNFLACMPALLTQACNSLCLQIT